MVLFPVNLTTPFSVFYISFHIFVMCAIRDFTFLGRLIGRILELIYGAKELVDAFGCNSAESEPIWVKSGAV